MTSSITYGIVMLTIDSVTLFLQPLDVQNVCKNTYFSLNKSCGKCWQSVQEGGIIIDYEGFVHIFNILCVRIKIIHTDSDLWLNISLSVSQS